MINRRVWGVFLRRPTLAEWIIMMMSLVLAVQTVLPSFSRGLDWPVAVVLCMGFLFLFFREAQCDHPRYFYKWLWALFATVKLNARLVAEVFTPQTAQLLNIVLFIVLLRSIHTYNLANDRLPLFFRREDQ
ncbi:hypothetical protein [Larkinella soli]|uniref:hypothetical protein n=1 Tax=Larkinella soli TaxID=1770527 RepID=UPI000FFB6FEA|nr:hypothetical protein [Larkinella soli]